MQPIEKSLASFIDHTLLKPEVQVSHIQKLCEEALQFGFFGVCVNSAWIPAAVKFLGAAKVAPVAVIGFPLGAMASPVKAFETKWCVDNGAKEIDMVIPVGLLKAAQYAQVEADIRTVVLAAGGLPVKVILETALLTTEEKIKACELSLAAGARFVKTCTGFGGGSATVEDIRLMRSVVGPSFGVKASGGIKTRELAQALINAGATRLGTSSGVALVGGSGTSPEGSY